MRLIGRRSVASVLRWILGFANVFVMLAVVFLAVGLLATLIMPDFAAGIVDGFRDADSQVRVVGSADRATFLGGFVATLSTWWIINRLRRMFLAVNQGDAFEPANVGRLQGIGLGLIGIEISAAILIFAEPVVGDLDLQFEFSSWLAILIVFMLAEVFRQGAAMRDDQQMTV